jgi:hypothetical protein
LVEQLKEKFPILEERFEGDWPAKALMQSFLKHTSSVSLHEIAMSRARV